jgi:transglutaminase-like putative cysteine protease
VVDVNRSTPTFRVNQPRLIDVVEWMRRFAHKGKSDLEIRQLVETICKDLVQGDYASEVLAIYYWVCQNIRYMRDIHDVEFVKEPRQVVATRSGDCDDIATLLAAMCMACGNTCEFLLASYASATSMPTHVFLRVTTPSGPMVLDPVANRLTAQMLDRMANFTALPV